MGDTPSSNPASAAVTLAHSGGPDSVQFSSEGSMVSSLTFSRETALASVTFYRDQKTCEDSRAANQPTPQAYK